ncbi:hypothetical protein [Mannheimia indoligenes]
MIYQRNTTMAVTSVIIVKNLGNFLHNLGIFIHFIGKMIKEGIAFLNR